MRRVSTTVSVCKGQPVGGTLTSPAERFIEERRGGVKRRERGEGGGGREGGVRRERQVRKRDRGEVEEVGKEGVKERGVRKIGREEIKEKK